LRDNLHHFVIKEETFPWNPKEALRRGFAAAERAFIEAVSSIDHTVSDRSGSCAVVLLVVEDIIYCANVGDSRALVSGEGGTRVFPLTKDHKPNEENEARRILTAGGKIYQ
jgi:protein phosphatase 2C family protein 2/3